MSSTHPFHKVVSIGFVAILATSLHFALPQASFAQLAPGPYEILPFDDAFIIEAFKDLDPQGNYVKADWTGWAGNDGKRFLVSPHPYDAHTGTDFSVQTGTPLHAAAPGVITELYNGFARNGGTNYGNYIRISVDAPAPNGEQLDLYYCHMLSVSVTNGQRVNVGDLVGLSDNTGQSDSEHVHFQSEYRGGTQTCPFYWAHFKYPIMFNSTGTIQVGRIVKITATSTPIRSDRYQTSPQISTAWENQLYFGCYAKRGFYLVMLPNNSSYKSGWVKATDVEEVFTGTVIQALPDNVTFSPTTQLQTKYPVRAAASDGASQIGQIVFGGGRFVADQITNGYYRIPFPTNSAMWGWVKPTSRMVIYPELTNPNVNLSGLTNNDFPIREPFNTVTNKCVFGRPKFNRPIVTNYGGRTALFVTDATNGGTATSESVSVGKAGHANYFVQCDVYLNYRPSYLVSDGGYERYGIFIRDDGFAGLDTTYEGDGNCYAILWDADDGKVRVGPIVDASTANMQISTNTTTGWHTFRIEARTNEIKYLVDGQLLLQTNDTTFPSGLCGVGYSMHFSGYPAGRGAYFDNFIADSFDPPRFESVTPAADQKVKLALHGPLTLTNAVEQTTNLSSTNWTFFTNVINSNATIEFLDATTNSGQRFYRARQLP